jgi:hypothetical protein
MRHREGNMLSRSKFLFLFGVLLFGVFACASYKRSMVDVDALEAYARHCKTEGICMLCC